MGTLTKFGKEVRKLRIERGETMMDMAKKLGKAPSFLSAIETGNKTPPESIVASLISEYELDEHAAQSLQEAAFESAATFKIRPATQNQRELVAAFARKLDSLTSNQLDNILQVLNKK